MYVFPRTWEELIAPANSSINFCAFARPLRSCSTAAISLRALAGALEKMKSFQHAVVGGLRKQYRVLAITPVDQTLRRGQR